MKILFSVLWLSFLGLLPSLGNYPPLKIPKGTTASIGVLKYCQQMFKQLDSSPTDIDLFKELLDTMILYNIAPRELGISDAIFMRLMSRYPGPLPI